jgi:hypothetical protein
MGLFRAIKTKKMGDKVLQQVAPYISMVFTLRWRHHAVRARQGSVRAGIHLRQHRS